MCHKFLVKVNVSCLCIVLLTHLSQWVLGFLWAVMNTIDMNIDKQMHFTFLLLNYFVHTLRSGVTRSCDDSVAFLWSRSVAYSSCTFILARGALPTGPPGPFGSSLLGSEGTPGALCAGSH